MRLQWPLVIESRVPALYANKDPHGLCVCKDEVHDRFEQAGLPAEAHMEQDIEENTDFGRVLENQIVQGVCPTCNKSSPDWDCQVGVSVVI